MKQIREALYLGILIGFALFGFYALFIQSARPGVSCSVPNTFSNGMTADATQVNANFAALVACFANSAAAGANSDITSLTGLTTPITAAAGGSTVYVGGTATGTANAIVLAAPTPTGFTGAFGQSLIFLAGPAGNTGATTITVGGIGPIVIVRTIPGASGGLVGGEILAGTLTRLSFFSSSFAVLETNYAAGIPGMVMDYAGAGGCPVGWLEANGGSFVTANFPALNTVLGTTWGVAGTLPDLRGRATFSRDSGGSARITVAGGNFDGTGVGNTGGGQNQILTQVQLPNVAPTFTGTPATLTTNQTDVVRATGGVLLASGANVAFNNSGALTISYTPGGTISALGSGSPHPILSPSAIVLKCVKL